MPEHDVVTQTSAEQLLALRNAIGAVYLATHDRLMMKDEIPDDNEMWQVFCESLYGRETGLVVDAGAMSGSTEQANQFYRSLKHPNGSDICECGDFRSQHENNGPCALNWLHAYAPCQQFVFVHESSSRDRAIWEKHFPNSNRQP